MPICCDPIRDALYNDAKVRGIIHGIDDSVRSDTNAVGSLGAD